MRSGPTAGGLFLAGILLLGESLAVEVFNAKPVPAWLSCTVCAVIGLGYGWMRSALDRSKRR